MWDLRKRKTKRARKSRWHMACSGVPKLDPMQEMKHLKLKGQKLLSAFMIGLI
jgi:hypothetical protein